MPKYITHSVLVITLLLRLPKICLINYPSLPQLDIHLSTKFARYHIIDTYGLLATGCNTQTTHYLLYSLPRLLKPTLNRSSHSHKILYNAVDMIVRWKSRCSMLLCWTRSSIFLTYLVSSTGVFKFEGGKALWLYGAPSGLTKLPYSLPNRSNNHPTFNETLPLIGKPSVLSK